MEMRSGKRAIDKIYHRRHRYDIPEWQRTEVWNDPKKRTLIDSILRGWKLPKFYFQLTDAQVGEYDVVDGQQRLSAIYDFFSGDLVLPKEAEAEFGGTTYQTLFQNYKDAFDDFEIEFDIIENADEPEIRQFFQRLQAGLPLISSENLNSIHSNLRDFSWVLARTPFFAEKVWLADKRYAHFDIAAKVAAIELDGIDTSLRFDDLKVTFESQASFSDKSQTARRLLQACEYLDRVFPEKSQILRNRTVVQSFATVVAKIVQIGRGNGREKALKAFLEAFTNELAEQVELGLNATDKDYIEFQRSINANVRTGPRTRHRILLRKMFAFDPSFAEVFEATELAGADFPGHIAELAEHVAAGIERANEIYAAVQGEDLFKPTNKTVKALRDIAKPARDMQGYERLVDALYFLVRESVGQRLREGVPQSFSDVVDLRTALRHDLDHGSVRKAAKRRKGVAETFKRYAGAGTPTTVDPVRFVVVQASLLRAIGKDIKDLQTALVASDVVPQS